MNDLLYAACAAAVLLGFLIVVRMKNKRIAFAERKTELTEQLLSTVHLTAGSEADFTGLLEVLSTVIPAPSYAVYLRKDDSLVLKAVRQKYDGDLQIGPSYSGLLPYQKEAFFLPASLPAGRLPKTVSVRKEGDVPLLFIPVEKSLILIGPVKKIEKSSEKFLASLVKDLEPILNVLIEWDKISERYSSAAVKQDAVKNAFSSFPYILRTVLGVSVKAINAAGVLLVASDGSSQPKIAVGFDKADEEKILNDKSVLATFENLIGSRDWKKISRSDPEFSHLPVGVAAQGREVFLLIRIPAENMKCFAAYWYSSQIVFPEKAAAVLQVMSNRLGNIVSRQRLLRELSGSYVDFLKMVATLMDNLKPWTVGKSELMSRYAYHTAKEMKLSDREAEEIATAAYLSNIGIIGMSRDLLFKTGKYSELEFEKMKLHSEAGAAIIEATIGNDAVASCIRYHHERVDGYGYPKGLKGEEIPVGARIIFVVQTYLAKITFREYRPALPFEEAINQLHAAAGTQLDPKAVKAFSGWFDRLEKEAAYRDGPLQPCWVMRCSPEDICVDCPAYQKKQGKCWENKGVNCRAHGDSCENCFIYTEYLWRQRRFHYAGTSGPGTV